MVSSCTNCGREIRDESFVYCPFCGNKLKNNGRLLKETSHVVFALGVEFMILALFAAFFYKTYDFGTFLYTDYPLSGYSFPLFYVGVLSIVLSLVFAALGRRRLRA